LNRNDRPAQTWKEYLMNISTHLSQIHLLEALAVVIVVCLVLLRRNKTAPRDRVPEWFDDLQQTPSSTPADVSLIVTSSSGKLQQSGTLQWRPSDGTAVGNVIFIDSGQRFQSIVGFGGAFTDGACFVLNGMAAPARDALFHELFDASTGLGLSLCRVCMGASDYSASLYSYDDSAEPDPDLKRFTIDHDRRYILPMLREARAVNPDMFLFGSPWSPPGWMKANNSMLGGSMRRQYMPSYANYFVRFITDYAAEGVPVQAVTVQNEVDTDQDGRMPACLWPQEYEVDFVRNHLGPAFEQGGIKTQIWLIDHNYNLWGRALGSLDTEGVTKYASAIAWHGYVGDPERMSRVHNAFPQTDMYWTEGGPDVTDPDYSLDWTKWAATFTGTLRNWCRGVTAWNLALDEKGQPNIGPFPCGGVVTVDSKTGEVTRSGQYYALAHFAKFVKRGASRIASGSADITGVLHVAFRNPDGENVLVLTNTGKQAIPLVIEADMNVCDITIEPNSIATLVWRNTHDQIT
jgi:glucosylceramidase